MSQISSIETETDQYAIEHIPAPQCNQCWRLRSPEPDLAWAVVKMGEGISFGDAYGKILGTLLVCCWWSVALSFMPPKMLKRVFPPVVTGVTIFLIGASLITAGIDNWGGEAETTDT